MVKLLISVLVSIVAYSQAVFAEPQFSPELLLNEVVVPVEAINLSIDRRKYLSDLFYEVTHGENDQEIVESWVTYLQKNIAHSAYAPMHPNGVMLTDPVWIMENRVAQCGQTNRVMIDGLSVVGYKTRLVQLKAHIAGEVWLDGAWRFIDADWLHDGQFIRKPDGSLASARDIVEDRSLLEGIDQNSEFRRYPVDIGWRDHQRYEDMFEPTRITEELITPWYRVKTATPEQEKDLTFGWDYYKVETE